MESRLEGQPGGLHPPYLRDRFTKDPTFRSLVEYTVSHAIPYSVFLGRVVKAGEPEWLPEDRDIVALWYDQSQSRYWCGHWEWEDREGFEPGYLVCAICEQMGPYEEKIRRQNQERQTDQHGLTFGWFPPREEEHGD